MLLNFITTPELLAIRNPFNPQWKSEDNTRT